MHETASKICTHLLQNPLAKWPSAPGCNRVPWVEEALARHAFSELFPVTCLHKFGIHIYIYTCVHVYRVKYIIISIYNYIYIYGYQNVSKICFSSFPSWDSFAALLPTVPVKIKSMGSVWDANTPATKKNKSPIHQLVLLKFFIPSGELT